MLLLITWMTEEVLSKMSGYPGRHVPGVQPMSSRNNCFQRQSDGKGCFPQLPQELEERWTCLATFSSPWGWLISPMGVPGSCSFRHGHRDSRWSIQPKEPVCAHWSFKLVARMHASGQTCAFSHNHHNPPHKFSPQVLPLFAQRHFVMMDFMWTASMAEHAGAAKRRRERRLRAHLRYARMSVAMALAESNHHAAPREQKTARAGRVGTRSTTRRSSRTTHCKEPGTEYYGLDDDSVPELSGTRPTPLVEARPQGQVQRHTVEHIVDVSPFVQILDVLVPQMGYQLVELMKMLDTATPVEQVIAVPQISQDRIPLGGSAGCRVSFLSAAATCRAERGHSSSSHSC